MLKRLSLVFVMVIALAMNIQAAKWMFDASHSEVGFKVKHLMISSIPGTFNDYDGIVMFDGKNWKDASVEVTIQMSSIDTGDKKRDDHLRSADFFEVEKYSTMIFKSSKVTTPDADGNFKIKGDLTIKDVTKSVTLNAEFHGIADDPWGNTRSGFSAVTTINRQDYNVSFHNKLQDGKLIVGNKVKIILEIELIKEKSK